MDGYAVNGTALVYVGTGGAGALELLGYTDFGVDMAVNENKGEIITDLFGPMTPQDFQDFGMTGRISVPLIALDSTVQNKIIDRGDRTTVGLLNTPGLVLGVAGYAFRVAIAAPLGIAPWSFSKCVTMPQHGTRLATKANPYRMEFFAWPYVTYTATTGKDVPVFTRSLS